MQSFQFAAGRNCEEYFARAFSAQNMGYGIRTHRCRPGSREVAIAELQRKREDSSIHTSESPKKTRLAMYLFKKSRRQITYRGATVTTRASAHKGDRSLMKLVP